MSPAPVQLRETMRLAIATATATAAQASGWGLAGLLDGGIERPRNPAHGDYSSNVALLLSRRLARPALELASAIATHLPLGGPIAAVGVASPGFINLTVATDWLADQLTPWLHAGDGGAMGKTALSCAARTLGEARLEANLQALASIRASLDRAELPALLRARLATMAPALGTVQTVRDGTVLSAAETPNWLQLMAAFGHDRATLGLLLRPVGAPLQLDLDLAGQETAENPAYYICYTYTRVCGVLRLAAELGLPAAPESLAQALRAHEAGTEARALLLRLVEYGDTLAGVADTDEPSRLTHYLLALAGDFHRFYAAQRVFGDVGEPATARLGLIHGARGVMRHALVGLLGTPPNERLGHADFS